MAGKLSFLYPHRDKDGIYIILNDEKTYIEPLAASSILNSWAEVVGGRMVAKETENKTGELK